MNLTPFFSDALTHPVESWGPLPEAIGEPMETSGFTLWEEGDQMVGIWCCTTGHSRWDFKTHEMIVVVAGKMICTVDGGEAVELKTGDTAFVPKGWSGTWEIIEDIRKLFTIFD